MTYTTRPSAGMSFTKAPTIAIAGPSGCGKTESAMRLARGFCGPKEPFCVIDTEEKRALYKNARYQPWDWMDFQPPFTPENYVAALDAVKHYKAVILDSGSHEYSGPGGLDDIQAASLEKMSKGNADRMDALSGPAWRDAKLRHKQKFMAYLIRYPTLLIVCLRAEPKVKFVKVEKNGRMVNEIVDAGYQPICEKEFMYEMLVGCKMDPSKAGVPEHVKRLETELEPIFPAGEQINEKTGERLAAWCAVRGTAAPATEGFALSGEPPAYITDEQAAQIETLCVDHSIKLADLKAAANVPTVGMILAKDFARALAWIDKKRQRADMTDAEILAIAGREVRMPGYTIRVLDEQIADLMQDKELLHQMAAKYLQRSEKVETERDALRSALQRARECLIIGQHDDAIAAIDEALGGTK